MQVCHAGCGPKVFAKLVPHMKEYGRMGQRVEELRAQIEQLDQRAIKFKDYQRSKQEMEHELIRQGATEEKRRRKESDQSATHSAAVKKTQ